MQQVNIWFDWACFDTSYYQDLSGSAIQQFASQRLNYEVFDDNQSSASSPFQLIESSLFVWCE